MLEGRQGEHPAEDCEVYNDDDEKEDEEEEEEEEKDVEKDESCQGEHLADNYKDFDGEKEEKD